VTGAQASSAEPVSSFVWELAKILMLALVIVIPLRFLVFQPFIVSGSSMDPNFHHGDYLVIDEISYRFGNPARGDVVVVRSPQDDSVFFIKRVIGLPKEKVVFTNNKVKIYRSDAAGGETLSEDYLPPGTRTAAFNQPTVKLGPDEYFLLGDNREASSDSRVWGPLPRREIVGRAFVRMFPITRFSLIDSPVYALPN